MRSLILPCCLALALAACAGENRATDVLPGERSSTATAKSVLNTVGTPFYAVGKGVTCVASAVVAVPVAGAAQLLGRPSDQELQQQTYQGVGRTCGGPYRLGAK
jgi:hypothetical protein